MLIDEEAVVKVRFMYYCPSQLAIRNSGAMWLGRDRVVNTPHLPILARVRAEDRGRHGLSLREGVPGRVSGARVRSCWRRGM
jgi:hypothetical protein